MLDIKEEELKTILPLDGPSTEEVQKYLEKYNEEIFAETKSGDLLVGHFNTFHISGINSSKKVRYTMLVRASNIMGPNFLV